MGTIRKIKQYGIVLLSIVGVHVASGQEWKEKVRGSWIANSSEHSKTILADSNGVVDIVVSPHAHSCVKQAAKFLAQDIAKITGQNPAIVPTIRSKTFIRLATIDKDTVLAGKAFESLKGKWEAHTIQTVDNGIWLVGSNPRGTAFASYTLSERLGVDPLYQWTGYTPEKHNVLRVKNIDYSANEPTVKYRGMFHDDEDNLTQPVPEELRNPRWSKYSGGKIDDVWYKRYFETALRLRMNQVAPFTRSARPFHIQKMASDWGLFYSSHHYDILLSNPWGYDRFGLAKERGVEGLYDWDGNREGILKYWKGGIEENMNLDCIWPVGLRGQSDRRYTFPKGMTMAEKNKVFADAITQEVEMVKAMLPKGKKPIFHFTLYHEMLDAFQSGSLVFPEDVILVWNDNGDGIMRALPEKLGKWKHGIYYHLGFFGNTTKQTAHTITPKRIEEEFRKVVNAGATEYMLVNNSEVRPHIMNTRFIAEICWDAKAAFNEPNAADRFTKWWSKEYFGKTAADNAFATYQGYFNTIHSYDQIWQGAMSLDKALYKAGHRVYGNHVQMDAKDKAELKEMRERQEQYKKIIKIAEQAEAKMTKEQALFFFDNAMYGMLIDYRPTQAAVLTWESLTTWPKSKSRDKIRLAMGKLQLLKQETLKAEFPPFEKWYRETWARGTGSLTNVHYAYHQLNKFLEQYDPKFKKKK